MFIIIGVVCFINAVNIICILALGYNTRNWRLVCQARLAGTVICIATAIISLIVIFTNTNFGIILAFFLFYGLVIFENLVFMAS